MCGDCTDKHKALSHKVDRIADIEETQFAELRSLVVENRSKIAFCREAATNLESSQQELQMQRENARGLIQETFQTYKAYLDAKQVRVVSRYVGGI